MDPACSDESPNGAVAHSTEEAMCPEDASTTIQPSNSSHGEIVPKQKQHALELTKTRTKYQRGWRRIIRNFTPSWFSVNMGTGVVSILLHNLPYNGRWLQYISYVIFALNIFLFVLFLFISVLRYTLYPEIWRVMIRHHTQSLFLGTFPMGLATIVNMIAFVCVPAWGGDTWKLAWALWWIDVVFAVSICFYLPFVIMADHQGVRLDTMTATWLLPVVSTIVAAGSGSVVANIIPHQREALITLITSYVLLGTGLPLALCILVIYFLRLTTAKLPPKEVIVSTFLPLGPLGQGGFAAVNLGKVAMTLFRKTHTLSTTDLANAGEVLYIIGFLVQIILWGFGLVWLFFAVATIHHTKRFPFNMGWWGFVFPLGVYSVSTVALATEIPSGFFRILGAILSLAVVLLWIVVSCGTAHQAYIGKIFVAPCLKDLDKKDVVEIDKLEKKIVKEV